MAKTYTDQVYSGTMPSTETTIATIAANTTFILKGLWISNASTTTDITANVKINDKRFMAGLNVPHTDTIIQDNLQIPITTGGTIKISAGSSANLDYYIWGVNEVTS